MFKSIYIQILILILILASACNPISVELEDKPPEGEIETTLTLTPSQPSAAPLEAVLFTATVNAVTPLKAEKPTGTVKFKIFSQNGNELDIKCEQELRDEIVNCPITFPTPQTYRVEATYNGKKDFFNGSSQSISFEVKSVATNLTIEFPSGTVVNDETTDVGIGESIDVTIRLSRTDGGTFSADTTSIPIFSSNIKERASKLRIKDTPTYSCSPNAPKPALATDRKSYFITCHFTPEKGGSIIDLKAAFAGNNIYDEQSAQASFNVQNKVDTSVALTCPQTGSVFTPTTFTATLTTIGEPLDALPKGTVVFSVWQGDSKIGNDYPIDLLANQTAPFTQTFYTMGSYTIKAIYTGEQNRYNPAPEQTCVVNFDRIGITLEVAITPPITSINPGETINNISVTLKQGESYDPYPPPQGTVTIKKVQQEGRRQIVKNRSVNCSDISSSTPYKVTCSYKVDDDETNPLSLEAVYKASGTAYGDASEPLPPITVNVPIETKLVLTPIDGSSAVNHTETFTATVTPTKDTDTQPTGGKVDFTLFRVNGTTPEVINGGCKNVALSVDDHTAQCPIIFMTQGNYEIDAKYYGAAGYKDALDRVSYNVGLIPTVLQFNPIPPTEIEVGDDVQMHVTLKRQQGAETFMFIPSGKLSVAEIERDGTITRFTSGQCDSIPINTENISGRPMYTGTCKYPANAVKTLKLQVTYNADNIFYGSSFTTPPFEITVKPKTPRISIDSVGPNSMSESVNRVKIKAVLTNPTTPNRIPISGDVDFFARYSICDPDLPSDPTDTRLSHSTIPMNLALKCKTKIVDEKLSCSPVSIKDSTADTNDATCVYDIITPFDDEINFYAKFTSSTDNFYDAEPSPDFPYIVHRQPPSFDFGVLNDGKPVSEIFSGGIYTVSAELKPLIGISPDAHIGNLSLLVLYNYNDSTQIRWVDITNATIRDRIRSSCNIVSNIKLTCTFTASRFTHAILAYYAADENDDDYYTAGCSQMVKNNEYFDPEQPDPTCPSSSAQYHEYYQKNSFSSKFYPWYDINTYKNNNLPLFFSYK